MSKKTARVVIPWEMPDKTINIGQKVKTTDIEGKTIGNGKIIAIKQSSWQNKRKLLSLEVPFKETDKIVGIRIIDTIKSRSLNKEDNLDDENIIICRCERISKKDIVDYIKKTNTRDFNALKAALRVGLGACGGKTCTDLIMNIFKSLKIDIKNVEVPVERPFTQEVPLKSFLDEGER